MRLHKNYLWAILNKIETFENFKLHSLDVETEERDLIREGSENMIKRATRNSNLSQSTSDFLAELFVLLVRLNERENGATTWLVSTCKFYVAIRTRRTKRDFHDLAVWAVTTTFLSHRGMWLNKQSPPTYAFKQKCIAGIDTIIGTRFDKKARRLVFKKLVNEQIFPMLRHKLRMNVCRILPQVTDLNFMEYFQFAYLIIVQIDATNSTKLG